jgi:hypothetical protein
MIIFDKITELLFDEDTQNSTKLTVVVLSIIAVIAVDNLLGFSFYYNADKKIELINKLNATIKDSTSDVSTKSYVINLRQKVINRQDFITQSLYFFRGKPSAVKIDQTIIPTAKPKPIDVAIKNNFWFHLTSSGFYYSFALFMIPFALINDKKQKLGQRIQIAIIAPILITGVGLLFYWLYSFIPQISNSTWGWNYAINFILQSSPFVFFRIKK